MSVLMGTVVHQISKNAKNENLQLKEVPQTLDEERFRQSLETQLIQVKQLFHEATMVSGIGQGGDGQTPGSGEVNILNMDDVTLLMVSPMGRVSSGINHQQVCSWVQW